MRELGPGMGRVNPSGCGGSTGAPLSQHTWGKEIKSRGGQAGEAAWGRWVGGWLLQWVLLVGWLCGSGSWCRIMWHLGKGARMGPEAA